jgi:MSHA biogenesis protein MshK
MTPASRVGSALLAASLLSGAAWAQDLRDPTQPPAAALQPQAAGTGGNSGNSGGGDHAMSLIVRDGKPYLVVGTRLYAQGQSFGKTQVVRITETEVTLREDGQTRVLRPFEGIQRHAVAVTPACTASAPKPRRGRKGGADVVCGNTKP